MRRQTDLRSLVRGGVWPAHQLPINASSVPCLSILPAGCAGTPCASTLRQQGRGVIYKSPGRPRLEATLHAGERPSCVGSDQSALTAPGKMNQGADMLSRNNVVSEEWTLHPLAVQIIWEVFGRAGVDLFISEDNSHCPIFFTKARMPWHASGPVFRSMLSFQPRCYRRYSGESGNDGTSLF